MVLVPLVVAPSVAARVSAPALPMLKFSVAPLIASGVPAKLAFCCRATVPTAPSAMS